MQLSALQIADPPERWQALGFTVRDDCVHFGDVTLQLGAEGAGITAWSLPALDGLATFAAPHDAQPVPHPNGSTGIDHVVIITPDFDRTSRKLGDSGLPLRRVRDAGGFRQGFRRVGPAILELVENPHAEDRSAPARFWGLVPIVEDLDALKKRLGDLLSDPKPAVQPGRRIATIKRQAGISTALAFMDPDR